MRRVLPLIVIGILSLAEEMPAQGPAVGAQWSWMLLGVYGVNGYSIRMDQARRIGDRAIELSASYSTFSAQTRVNPQVDVIGFDMVIPLTTNGVRPYVGLGVGGLRFDVKGEDFPPCETTECNPDLAEYRNDIYAILRPTAGVLWQTKQFQFRGNTNLYIRKESPYNGDTIIGVIALGVGYEF